MLAFYLSIIEGDGDQALFVKLYERYERKLYGVAYHILGSQSRAEDAVQETMLKVIDHFDEAKKIFSKSCTKFDSWIVIIVKNVSLDMLRKERPLVELEEDWDMPSPVSVRGETEFRALVEVIRNMPETYRAVLELRLVNEWSFEEIGRTLGIPANTARTKFQRGRALLRERLEAMGYSYQ